MLGIYRTGKPNPWYHDDKYDVALCPPYYFTTGYAIGDIEWIGKTGSGSVFELNHYRKTALPIVEVLTWRGWRVP